MRTVLRKNQGGILHHLGLFMLLAVVVAVAGFAGIKTYNSVKHDKKSGAAGYSYYDSLGFPVPFALGANAGVCKMNTTLNGASMTTIYHRANLVAPNPYASGVSYRSILTVFSSANTSLRSSEISASLNSDKTGSITVDTVHGETVQWIAASSDTGGRGAVGALDLTKVGSCDGATAPLGVGMKIVPLRAISAGEQVQIAWATSGAPSQCTASDGWSGTVDAYGSVKTVTATAFSGYTLTCTKGANTTKRTYYPNMAGTVVNNSNVMTPVSLATIPANVKPDITACKQTITASGTTYYNLVFKAVRKSNSLTSINLTYVPTPGTYINMNSVTSWNNNVAWGAILASKPTDMISLGIQTTTAGYSAGLSAVQGFSDCDIPTNVDNYTFYNSNPWSKVTDYKSPQYFGVGAVYGLCKENTVVAGKTVVRVRHRLSVKAPSPTNAAASVNFIQSVKGANRTVVQQSELTNTFGSDTNGAIVVDATNGEGLEVGFGSAGRGAASPTSLDTIGLCSGTSSVVMGMNRFPSWSQALNTPVTITWKVAGNPDQCTASGMWSGAKASSGSQVVTPASFGGYKLTCTKSGQTFTQTVYPNITATPDLDPHFMTDLPRYSSPYGFPAPAFSACKRLIPSQNNNYLITIRAVRPYDAVKSASANLWTQEDNYVNWTESKSWNTNGVLLGIYASSLNEQISAGFDSTTVKVDSLFKVKVSTLRDCF